MTSRPMELSVGAATCPVVAVVPTSMAPRIKNALRIAAGVQFVSPNAPASERHQAISGAHLLVIDPSAAAGGGAEDVRIAATLGIPSVVVVSMSDFTLVRILAAIRHDPLDVVFDRLDPSSRLKNATEASRDRRLSMQFACELHPELVAMPVNTGLHCFATICGATLPRDVKEFCLKHGLSVSTGSRRLAKAGIPSVHTFLVGSRLVQVLDSLRHPTDLKAVAHAFGFGCVRSLHRSLWKLGGTTAGDLRAGADPTDVVGRIAGAVRRPQS